jgi:hypothetical protein
MRTTSKTATAAAWVAAIILSIATAFSAYARDIPAFPGAEGYGSVTPGGRGGKVIAVTNLNASGPGSLQAACEAEGPRIVVFKVAGTIEGTVSIRNDFITIAGQTAPGDGITIKGHLGIGANPTRFVDYTKPENNINTLKYESLHRF